MTNPADLIALETEGKESGPSPEDFAKMMALVAEQARLVAAKARLEAELARTNALLQANVERELPEALIACRIEDQLPTSYGLVKLKRIVAASPKADDKPKVVAWLESIDRADLVKTKLGLFFAKGEHELLEEVLQLLRDAPFANQLAIETEKSVHGGSLSKFVREHLKREITEQGVPTLPRDLFGIFEGYRAEIVALKAKKNDEEL